MAKKGIGKGDIKLYLRKKIEDNVEELRRQLAVDRININRAIGVGNFADYAREFETDFASSTTGLKENRPKNKNLKKLTTNKTEKRR